MNDEVTYHDFQEKDFRLLLNMGLKLWRGFGEAELEELLRNASRSSNQKIFISRNSAGRGIGFSIFSIRKDRVEGAKRSPTGYLEGIYVERGFRNQGISKQLLQLGENWLREKNCFQLGSDTWIQDTESRNFHSRLGFWEKDELVHFLKDLG